MEPYLFSILQVCSAGSRLLVQENIADKVIAKVKERMTHLRLGDSLDKSIDMGPIVDPSQKKSIDAYVQKAKEEGAEVGDICALTYNGFPYFILKPYYQLIISE